MSHAKEEDSELRPSPTMASSRGANTSGSGERRVGSPLTSHKARSLSMRLLHALVRDGFAVKARTRRRHPTLPLDPSFAFKRRWGGPMTSTARSQRPRSAGFVLVLVSLGPAMA